MCAALGLKLKNIPMVQCGITQAELHNDKADKVYKNNIVWECQRVTLFIQQCRRAWTDFIHIMVPFRNITLTSQRPHQVKMERNLSFYTK